MKLSFIALCVTAVAAAPCQLRCKEHQGNAEAGSCNAASGFHFSTQQHWQVFTGAEPWDGSATTASCNAQDFQGMKWKSSASCIAPAQDGPRQMTVQIQASQANGDWVHIGDAQLNANDACSDGNWHSMTNVQIDRPGSYLWWRISFLESNTEDLGGPFIGALAIQDNAVTSSPTVAPTGAPTMAPTIAPTTRLSVEQKRNDIHVEVLGGVAQEIPMKGWPGAKFVDEGALCNCGNHPPFNAAIKGDVVNTTLPGTYVIEYQCTWKEAVDGSSACPGLHGGLALAHRQVVITDPSHKFKLHKHHGRPVLTLIDGTAQYYEQVQYEGSETRQYRDPGARCEYRGNDISDKVSITGMNVNLTSQGEYIIRYNCEAGDGAAAVPAQRSVRVGPPIKDFRYGGFSFQGGNDWNEEKKRLETSEADTRVARDEQELADLKLPVIALNGKSHVRLVVHDTDEWHDPGASCFFQGHDLSAELTPKSSVVTLRKSGKTVITYHCRNAKIVQRVVEVRKLSAANCVTQGYFVDEDGDCTKCSAGTFGKNVTVSYSKEPILGCVPCPAGSYQPEAGKTHCLQVSAANLCRTAGHFTSAKTGLCEKCGAMQYEHNFVCMDCPRGQWSAEGSSSCQFSQCLAGQFQLADGTCEACAAGKYQNHGYKFKGNTAHWGRSFCFDCPEGTFNFLTGRTFCKKDTKCIAGAKVVKEDVSDTSSNAYTCEKCAVGKYANGPGTMACITCDASRGLYAPAEGMNKCLTSKCPAGSYSRLFHASEAHLESLLPVGWHHGRPGWQINSRIYNHHEAGIYELCTKCGMNTYQDLEGQPTCKKCTAGKFAGTGYLTCDTTKCGKGTFQKSWTVGAHKYGRCTPCPLNHYQDSDTAPNACTPCPEGEYTTDVGAKQCIKITCPAGSVQDVRYAQPRCHKCQPGQYQDKPASECLPCLKDKWTFVHGATKCNYATSCNPGSHWNIEQGRCVECQKGTYQSQMNMAKCLGCPVGKYQFRTGQNACQTINCKPGEYMAENYNKCLKCTVGEWSETGKLTYCYKCPRGYYNYEWGQTKCKKSFCTAGTYQSKLAVPKLNATGMPYSEKGEDGVVRKAMTTCHKCPQGTYQPLNGMFYCFKCKEGQFATNSGMTSCTSTKNCVKLKDRLYCQAKHRKMEDYKPYKCQNVKCRINHYKDFFGTTHRRMQVIHVPGHAWHNDQEPAEKKILQMAKDNGWDVQDPHAMWTAHHICKSNYALSTKPTEKERLEDCQCFCW